VISEENKSALLADTFEPIFASNKSRQLLADVQSWEFIDNKVHASNLSFRLTESLGPPIEPTPFQFGRQINFPSGVSAVTSGITRRSV